MADVPNRADIVDYVNRAHPELLRSNTHEDCSKFLQHFIDQVKRQHGERWGHLTKDPGENGFTYPNGNRAAIDVVVHYDTQWLVDIISGSGAPPQPGGTTWIPLGPQGVDRPWNEYMDMCAQGSSSSSCIPMIITPDGEDVEPAPRQGIPILITAFPVFAAEKKFPQQLEESLAWERSTLWPDGGRIFGHCMGGPWQEQLPDGRPGAAINKDWPDYRDVLKRAEERLARHEMNQNMLTFFGGPVPLDEGRRFIEQLSGWLDLSLWRYFEICNEWMVNGWRADDVRALCEHFSACFPSQCLIAPSSPHLTHNSVDGSDPTADEIIASMDELYAGIHTSWMTVHIMRDPNSPWYDPRNLSPLYPKAMGNTEPAGPGASAGGDENDPATIATHYNWTNEAHMTVYDRHCRFWVFMGHLDRDQWPQYSEDYPWDHPTLGEINAALWPLRNRDGEGSGPSGGGEPIPPQPQPQPPQTGDNALTPGERLGPGERLTSPNGRFYLEFQVDGYLCSYEAGVRPIWRSETPAAPPGFCEMQAQDGNLVANDASGTPRWASQSSTEPPSPMAPGASVQINDDGYFVMYLNGQPIWRRPEGAIDGTSADAANGEE